MSDKSSNEEIIKNINESEKSVENVIKEVSMVPRKLTESEIEDIVSIIPNVKSALEEVGRSIDKSMKEMLSEQLREIEIVPEGIQDLKDEIIQKYKNSLIKPGTMVGVHSAEALGHPITQMALNTFHFSGSSRNVTYGVSRIRELLNASKSQKVVSSSIYFKEKELTFDDILTKKRPEINKITVGNIVKDIPEYYSANEILSNPPWWYSIQLAFFGNFTGATSMVRLHLDKKLMYSYKLTMNEICNTIKRSSQENGNNALFCVFSPLPIGIIDIYAIDKEIPKSIQNTRLDSGYAGMTFLSLVVVKELDNIIIRGVPGISQIYPVETPVVSVIYDEIPMDEKDTWKIKYSEIRMLKTGITPKMITNLFQIAGAKILETHQNYAIVKIPFTPKPLEENRNKHGIKPLDYVNQKIQTDLKAEKEFVARSRSEGKFLYPPKTKLLKNAYLVYADSDGSSLRELLGRDDIDSTRTISNDVHEVNAVLGIEAARNFMINEINNVIAHEAIYINPRHIILLVDFMTSLGSVLGVTFSGVSRQQMGPLAKASFERALDTFKDAALLGEKETVRGTSANIYIGKEAPFGSNYDLNYIDPEMLKEFEKELKNDQLEFDVDDTIEAISNINIKDFGISDNIPPPSIENLPNESSLFGNNLSNLPPEENLFGPQQSTIVQNPSNMPPILPQSKLLHSKELDKVADKIGHTTCLKKPQISSFSSHTLLPSTPQEKTNVLKSSNLPSVKPTNLGIPNQLKQQMDISQQNIISPNIKDTEKRKEEKVEKMDIMDFLN